MQLVVQWAEQLLDERVRVLAVQVVGALVPAAVVLHVGALFEVANKVQVRRPPEVLLAVRVVAFGPLMFLVYVRTKARLVRVDHELFELHLAFMLVEVLREAALGHEISYCAALLGTEWQWIDLLLLLVQGLDALHQVLGRERVQFVWRRQLTVNDDKRAVEVGRAVNFKLVGERVPREPVTVTLEEQDMQADVVTSWMRNFAI